eukprot:6173584-Pleurochrysis_carterae.AAC.4
MRCKGEAMHTWGRCKSGLPERPHALAARAVGLSAAAIDGRLWRLRVEEQGGDEKWGQGKASRRFTGATQGARGNRQRRGQDA